MDSHIPPPPDPSSGGSKIGRLRAALLERIDQHEAAGTLATSARFLYYELIAAGVVPAEKKKHGRRVDQDVSDALTDLREQGRVPWGWIVDETRSLAGVHVAATVRQWMLDVLEEARIDPWHGDPPMIITESRSLAGVLRPLAYAYAVPLAATNGQVGGFLHTEVIPALHDRQRVLYLGDLDLSGGQIENNTRRVLERGVGTLRWERLALTEEQAARYSLTPIIKYDRRYRPPRPHEAIETEALRQEVIVDIVRGRLGALIPMPIAELARREERQRGQLRKLLDAKAVR